MKTLTTLAFAAGATFGLMKNNTAAAQNNASYKTAVYYNIHHKVDKNTGVGMFTGPVFNLNKGSVSYETNFYASERLTNDKSPLKVNAGVTAGVSFSKNGNAMYAAPNVLITDPKGKGILNKMYFIANSPLTSNLKHFKQPNMFFGVNFPIEKKDNHKNYHGIMTEFQRFHI